MMPSRYSGKRHFFQHADDAAFNGRTLELGIGQLVTFGVAARLDSST